MRRRGFTLGAGMLAVQMAAPGLAGASGPQRGDPALWRAVQDRLARDPVTRGRFEQQRTLQGFRNPLRSSGDFVVARGTGVIWRTLAPLRSSLVLTRERMVARLADGTESARLNARDDPTAAVVIDLLFATMSADLATLATRFSASGEAGATSPWRLELVPLDTTIARVVTAIELEGERHVRQLRLREARGDLTVIRLLGHAPDTQLSRDELAELS